MLRSITWLAVGASALSFAQNESFLSRPDIHGDLVAFTAEGDVWIANLISHEARRLTSDAGLETNAKFSPDGSMIAFNANYEGSTDVYVMPTAGGTPKRLTYNPRRAEVRGWTRDGKSVLFRAPDKHWTNYLNQFFTVPVTGGMPKMVPVPRAEFGAFSPDGGSLAYVPDSNEWMNWFRYEGGEADKIWIANLQTGKFRRLTNSKGIDTQPVWVGDSIYFVSERTGVRNLWRMDPGGGRPVALTNSVKEPVRYPSSDGKRVVYEMGPKLGLYDPATNAASLLSIQLGSDRIHARPTTKSLEDSVEEASLGPTGKRIALVARGKLVTVPATEGELRLLQSSSAARVQRVSWSPDGKKLAFISDESGEEQLYLQPAMGGASKVLTKELKGTHFNPVWSPDGKWIAIGDREMRIQLVDTATGSVKLVAQGDRSGSYDQTNSDYTFSPDGRWLAYSQLGFGWISSVHLYSLESGKSVQLSNPGIPSTSPSFSPDGKFLFMVQARELNPQMSDFTAMMAFDNDYRVSAIALAADTPSPFAPKNDDEAVEEKKDAEPAKGSNGLPVTKVDLDGIAARLIDMKIKPGRYSAIAAISGKLLLLNKTTASLIAGPGPVDLLSFDIATKTLSSVASDVEGIDLSNDREKLLVLSGGGIQVVDANTGPITPDQGAVKLAGYSVPVDPVAEWRQIFLEGWRAARDFFYDPGMHGVDWIAVKAKYEAQLPMVGDRSDLTRLLGDMIAELNVGHCYVAAESPFAVPRRNMGMLGADLEFDPSAKACRIVKILKGDDWELDQRSPLSALGLGIKEGDFIFEIAGKSVRADEDPQALLLGFGGKTITLKVGSKASGEGARVVRVVPLASERKLRYLDWVESRRQYVAKASGGQIAYLHMSDMDTDGAIGFTKDYYGNVDKPALIVDVRANGGGFISANVLNHLATKITGFFKPRVGESWRREGWAPLGKVAALTDAWAFSDGEYFSEFFKRLKIGPLIGNRTGGGEVGSGGGYHFVDGGTISIPNYGAWTANGEWIIEGKGSVPDINIDQDPELVLQGKDPQLDKAIELLLAELKKTPFKMPAPPPFPVKRGGSSGG